jgi:L-alanine-DL-glutamate epimerase-like enolase superfamily enzyme
MQPLDSVAAGAPPGVWRIALTSAESDATRLVALLGAAADTVGPVVQLALHLDGQVLPNALGMLRDVGRRLKLAYIADPCADLVTACRAFGRGAPPLAVSAHRHAPRDLARAMRDGGVQVLLIDPVRGQPPRS